MSGHRAALLDWLACAYGGREQRAPLAARAAGDGLLERVAWLGTAGHVLDFDDTYLPGIAHLSAPTAPAAIALAASLDRSVGDALDAYAAGFEAMGRLSRSHDLYEGGWHPTAVCGAAGAAHTAARLLGLDEERTGAAERLALLQAGGLRAAFGSDGKSLQVGMAAAAGVHAARIAASGVTDHGRRRWTIRRASRRPSARRARRDGERGGRAELDQAVAVLPDEPQRRAGGVRGARGAGRLARADRGRRCTRWRGGPRPTTTWPTACRPSSRSRTWSPTWCCTASRSRPASTASTPDARALAAERVRLTTDESLRQAEAVVALDGEVVARVPASRGSPEAPMDADELAAKCRLLAGDAAGRRCSTIRTRRLRSCSTRWPEGGRARRRAAPGWRRRRRGRSRSARRRSR